MSSDHFDPHALNSNRFLSNKVAEIPKKIPTHKLPSITSNKLLDNKYKYIKEIAARSGSFHGDSPVKASLDASKTNVLLGSIGKLQKLKENPGPGMQNPNRMIYDQSIDANKHDGWRIRPMPSANESIAYGVGESIIKPHTLDESGAVFTLNMNKDFRKRIRKVDIERQQREMMKIQTQGQGAIKNEEAKLNMGDSLAVIRKLWVVNFLL